MLYGYAVCNRYLENLLELDVFGKIKFLVWFQIVRALPLWEGNSVSKLLTTIGGYAQIGSAISKTIPKDL
ncbi:hypothetical protein TNCV_4420691 [Trichonephila clavipes]|nr:hypothetical protein TNCV_4420691 [Trichonephila clavipes]